MLDNGLELPVLAPQAQDLNFDDEFPLSLRPLQRAVRRFLFLPRHIPKLLAFRASCGERSRCKAVFARIISTSFSCQGLVIFHHLAGWQKLSSLPNAN